MGCGASTSEFAIRNTGEALPLIKSKSTLSLKKPCIPKIKFHSGIIVSQSNDSPVGLMNIGYLNRKILCNRLSIEERMRLKITISKDMITDFRLFLKMSHIDIFENVGTWENPQSMLHYAMEMGSFRIVMVLLHNILQSPLVQRNICLLNLIDKENRIFLRMAKTSYDLQKATLLLERLGLTIKITKKKKKATLYSLTANKDSLNLSAIEDHLKSFFSKFKVSNGTPTLYSAKLTDKTAFDEGVFFDESFIPSDESYGSPLMINQQKGTILWNRLHEIYRVPLNSMTIFHTSFIKNINSPSKVIRALFSSIKDHPDFIRSIFVSWEVSKEGIYSVNIYGTSKHEIVVDDLFPVTSEDPSKLLCTSYESPEEIDITLPILEKCLAKFYGSYENLYQKADELGECVLYSVLFGMSHEIIELGYSERVFSDVLWGTVNELRRQTNIIKLRRLSKENSKAHNSFIPYDSDYNVILTFPSTHVKMTLVWDWSQANAQEDLLDKLQFGNNNVMWEIEHFDEEFCYDEELFKDRLYYMTSDEVSQNFDQVIVMYNMFPRHHKQLTLRKEKMLKGDFYEIQIDDFMELHIEMMQERVNGWMNMQLYLVKGDKLAEMGAISPSRLKLREPMRFLDNNLVSSVVPGTYLLRCILKPKEKKEKKEDLASPFVRITSSSKIKKLLPLVAESFLKKFESMHFSLILSSFKRIEFKEGVFLHKGPVELDHRYYYVVVENKNSSHKAEVWLRFFEFFNCAQSETKSSFLVKEDQETKINLDPESKKVFVFKEIQRDEHIPPFLDVEIIKK